MAAAIHTALNWRTFSPQHANQPSKGFKEEMRRKKNQLPNNLSATSHQNIKRILRNTATAALEHTAQGLQVVPLPCGQSPEEPPSAEMAQAIQLVSTPGHRHAGLQILIFNASWQLLSTPRSTGARFLRNMPINQARASKKRCAERKTNFPTTSRRPATKISKGFFVTLRLLHSNTLLRDCKWCHCPVANHLKSLHLLRWRKPSNSFRPQATDTQDCKY